MRGTMMVTIALTLVAPPAAAGQNRDPHVPPPTYDSVAPELPRGLRDGVLIVSKTNGWRHIEHIPHSNAVLAEIARASGRASFATENAAVFTDANLARFRVVVLNSASGDFLTPDQRAALDRWMAKGGGLVALHAAADDSHVWPTYRARVIGADFIGHPGGADHIQRAAIVVETPRHPVLTGIRLPWTARDEWYSHRPSPRAGGMTILARIDEASYRPGTTLAMGADHPVVWTSRWGRGRVVTSVLGHTPEAYDDPNYRRLLANAIRWVAKR